MTLSDELTLAISFLSLIVSGTVAYFAWLRHAKLEVLLGSNLNFFNSAATTPIGDQWGGVSFVLPLTFYNWSPQGGTVHQVRLILGQKDSPDTYFDMVWTNFVTFVDGMAWTNATVAQPIAIAGRSSVTQFIRFDWSPLSNTRLILREAAYTLTLLVWTHSGSKPSLREERTFTLERFIVQEFQTSVDQQQSFGFWVSIDNARRSNRVITETELKDYR